MTAADVKALAERNGVTITELPPIDGKVRVEVRTGNFVEMGFAPTADRAMIKALEGLAWAVADCTPVSQLLESSMGWAFDVFTEDGSFGVEVPA